MIYMKGDALKVFEETDNCILIHQVNCQGVMASGIARQIRGKYPEHYEDYRFQFHLAPKSSYRANLGDSFKTRVGAGKWVYGVFGQDTYGKSGKHTNYAAQMCGIESAVGESKWILDLKMDDLKVIIPKNIGCGLGGGDWEIVHANLHDLSKMYPDISFYIVDGSDL